MFSPRFMPQNPLLDGVTPAGSHSASTFFLYVFSHFYRLAPTASANGPSSQNDPTLPPHASNASNPPCANKCPAPKRRPLLHYFEPLRTREATRFPACTNFPHLLRGGTLNSESTVVPSENVAASAAVFAANSVAASFAAKT